MEMAKAGVPMPKAGGGVMSKVVSAFVVIGLAALIVKHPVGAAHMTTGGFSALGDVVDGLVTFIQQVSA